MSKQLVREKSWHSRSCPNYPPKSAGEALNKTPTNIGNNFRVHISQRGVFLSLWVCIAPVPRFQRTPTQSRIGMKCGVTIGKLGGGWGCMFIILSFHLIFMIQLKLLACNRIKIQRRGPHRPAYCRPTLDYSTLRLRSRSRLCASKSGEGPIAHSQGNERRK